MPVDVICENCGSEFERYQSDIKDRIFCSTECHNEWQRENGPTGKDSHGYNGGKKTAVCEYCGDRFKDYPSRIERAGGTYCSEECYGKEKKIEGAGTCHWCGDTFDELPSRLERSKRNFCSTECRSEWRSDYYSGSNSVLWEGGLSGHERNYGPNWDEQRQRCLERDGRCLVCDSTDDLVVHHKRRIKNFNRTSPGWWRTANDLDNLVTLCRSCHSKIHQNPMDYFGDLIG